MRIMETGEAFCLYRLCAEMVVVVGNACHETWITISGDRVETESHQGRFDLREMRSDACWMYALARASQNRHTSWRPATECSGTELFSGTTVTMC